MFLFVFALYLLALFCFAFGAARIGGRHLNLVALGLAFVLIVWVFQAGSKL